MLPQAKIWEWKNQINTNGNETQMAFMSFQPHKLKPIIGCCRMTKYVYWDADNIVFSTGWLLPLNGQLRRRLLLPLVQSAIRAVTALHGLSENRKTVTRAKSQRSEPTLWNFLHIVLTPKYTFGTKKAQKARTWTPSKVEFLILYCARSIQWNGLR